MIAQWDGSDDFDAITQYTEAFFDLSTNAGSGNYSKVYDTDRMIYVVDQSYPTFADLCNDQSWDTEEGNNVDVFLSSGITSMGTRKLR